MCWRGKGKACHAWVRGSAGLSWKQAAGSVQHLPADSHRPVWHRGGLEVNALLGVEGVVLYCLRKKQIPAALISLTKAQEPSSSRLQQN